MKAYYELADTLYNHTQIPYKYFEVGSLLLINVSNSEDPNRVQEYAVHKRTATGSFSKVESITVNGSSTTVLSLAKRIMSIDKKSIKKFSENARIFDEETSLNEVEDFKVRFENLRSFTRSR